MNLPLIPILSVATAIVISWALFAMFCSIVHEAVAEMKAERGRFMRKYLFQQLRDLPNGVNWASMLYLHGTIDLLSREANKPTNEIPPDVFAKTLVEVVGNAHIVQMQIPELEQQLIKAKNRSSTQPSQFVNTTQNHFSHATLYNFKAATQVLKQSAVVSMLSQALNSAELQANASSTEQWVTEAEVYKQLILFIGQWYSDFTGRLTYWYKKKTRQRLFILGCLLGLFLNVDSIQLFSFYTENPASREALINFYQQNADSLNSLSKRFQFTGSTNTDSILTIVTPSIYPAVQTEIKAALIRLRQHNNAPVVPTVMDNTAAEKAADSIASFKNGTRYGNDAIGSANDTPLNISRWHPAADTLRLLSTAFLRQAGSLRKAANLPVGFHYSVFQQRVHWFYPLLLKLFGILISGLAASFGGPFWFDVLKRIYTRK